MSWWYFLLLIPFNSVLTFESRVFSGDDLRFEEHKHLVKLKLKMLYKKFPGYCSGSILNNYWVITSAHCFRGSEYQVSIFHQTEEGQRIIAKADPARVNIHPEWKPHDKTMTNRANDLALVKTTHPIMFSDHVQPIKLSKTFPRSLQSGIIAGFGESETDLEPPREGFVEIEPCSFGVPKLLCSTHMVRAGSGDSGGSLMSNGKLVGVTSASCKEVLEPKECTTVYVSVAAHLPWIQEVIMSTK